MSLLWALCRKVGRDGRARKTTACCMSGRCINWDGCLCRCEMLTPRKIRCLQGVYRAVLDGREWLRR